MASADIIQIWLPYCGAAPAPGELLARWNFDPLLIGAIILFAWASWRFAAPGRRGALAAAVAVLVLLFVSPLCALSSALFAARVADHVLLAVAVAPLLAASLPALRPRGSLLAWTAAQALLFWLWHAPGPYAWALSSDGGYWLMQLSLLGSAIGFWAAIRRASAPPAVAALLATMVQMGLLGALITVSPVALYAPHFLGPQAWGLSPLADQQLGGLIMWAPAAGAYLLGALFLLNRWLGREQQAVAAR